MHMQVLKETIFSKSSTIMDVVLEILNVRQDLLIEELGNKALINELIEVALRVEQWHDKVEENTLAGMTWDGRSERWLAYWMRRFEPLLTQFELLLVESESMP